MVGNKLFSFTFEVSKIQHEGAELLKFTPVHAGKVLENYGPISIPITPIQWDLLRFHFATAVGSSEVKLCVPKP